MCISYEIMQLIQNLITTINKPCFPYLLLNIWISCLLTILVQNLEKKGSFYYLLMFLIMSPHLRGGDILFLVWILLGSVGITLTYLHNILWSSGWILTKFSWVYNWDITKTWLDFGDIDLIFKVSVIEKLEIHDGGGHLFFLKTLLLVTTGWMTNCRSWDTA